MNKIIRTILLSLIISPHALWCFSGEDSNIPRFTDEKTTISIISENQENQENIENIENSRNLSTVEISKVPEVSKKSKKKHIHNYNFRAQFADIQEERSFEADNAQYADDITESNSIDSNRVRRELTDDITKKYPIKNYIERKIDNDVWDTGEQLTFSIDYGFYRAGTAKMSVVGTEIVNGHLCYQIKTEAKSNKFISAFYKVRDTVTSYIDVDGIFTRRFEKKLREGNYESDRIVDFYPNRLIALNTRDKYALSEIPLYAQDILSALYLLRTYDLEVGKDETIDVYADGKVYPLKVIIHGIEKIKVSAGKFECFKVEPILKSEGIFRQKGKLLIWLTCDELKLPVKMKSKVVIGSITSNLEKYTTGVAE